MIFTDQIGHKIKLKHQPEKIISLVPSQTELLFDLQLEKEVIGITKFCVHPNTWYRTKTRVGGTKNPNIKKIRELNPDLIIANKEENRKEDILLLQKEFNVWTSDIFDLKDAMNMMLEIGNITRTSYLSSQIVSRIKFKKSKFNQFSSKKILYLIWKNPYMTIGKKTFISNFLIDLGLENVAFKLEDERYPLINIEDVKRLNPDYIFCSSEPYPFKQKDLIELKKNTGIKTILVDGEFFSWYGTRLLNAFDYFSKLKKQMQGCD